MKEESNKFSGYLLLGREGIDGKATKYRGIYRVEPAYPEAEGEGLDLWKRFALAHDEFKCLIPEKGTAFKLFGEYSNRGLKLDLVRVIRINNIESYLASQPPTDDVFLGFDVVSKNCYSAILDYPFDCDEYFLPEDKNKDSRYTRPLLTLADLYFSQLLNQFGLFNNLEDAEIFLKVELSLGQIFPKLFGSDIHELFIVAVFLVTSTIEDWV